MVCTEGCDKTIVIGHTDKEDTSWLKNRLPDWQHVLYNVETPSSVERLRVPKNKGNEAMAYLTYIINHYDSLPSVMLFLHAHEKGYRKAWHVDAPLHDQVYSIQNINLDYVHQQGYVSLRCILRPGCDSGTGGAAEDIDLEEWNQVFRDTSTPPGWLALQSQSYHDIPRTERWMNSSSPDFFAKEVPNIKITCCAQFAVTPEIVRQRPVTDYIAFRQWLLDTPKTNLRSGGVWEYLWHIVFGEQARLCPDPNFCYCALYGKC